MPLVLLSGIEVASQTISNAGPAASAAIWHRLMQQVMVCILLSATAIHHAIVLISVALSDLIRSLSHVEAQLIKAKVRAFCWKQEHPPSNPERALGRADMVTDPSKHDYRRLRWYSKELTIERLAVICCCHSERSSSLSLSWLDGLMRVGEVVATAAAGTRVTVIATEVLVSGKVGHDYLMVLGVSAQGALSRP